MGDEARAETGRDESLETRVAEDRWMDSLRPAGSLSPRYGVTKAERLEARGKTAETPPEIGEQVNRRLKLERRRKIVAENFISGLTPSQIAEAVSAVKGFENTTPFNVKDDLKVILRRWQQENLDAIEPHIVKIVARCERMINAVWSKAVNGDKDAQEQVRRNQQQLMRVLRIGQPVEAGEGAPGGNALGPGGQTVNIQQIITLINRDASELHDNELALIARTPVKLIEGAISHGTGHTARPVDPQIESDVAGQGADESGDALLDGDPGGPAADVSALDGGNHRTGSGSLGAWRSAGSAAAEGTAAPTDDE